MAKTSPTARTLALLREQGWDVENRQTWLPRAKRFRDAWGFADLEAMHPASPGVLLVQVTTGTNHAARKRKILAEPRARLALQCRNRIQVISWRLWHRGRPRPRWEPRVEELTLADFPAAEGTGT